MVEWIILENLQTDALEPRRARIEATDAFLMITIDDLQERIPWATIDKARKADDGQRISESDILHTAED